jgi:hypothetical protein
LPAQEWTLLVPMWSLRVASPVVTQAVTRRLPPVLVVPVAGTRRSVPVPLESALVVLRS